MPQNPPAARFSAATLLLAAVCGCSLPSASAAGSDAAGAAGPASAEAAGFDRLRDRLRGLLTLEAPVAARSFVVPRAHPVHGEGIRLGRLWAPPSVPEATPAVEQVAIEPGAVPEPTLPGPRRVDAAALGPAPGWGTGDAGSGLEAHLVAGEVGGVHRLEVPVDLAEAGVHEVWVRRAPRYKRADFFLDARPPVRLGEDLGEGAGHAGEADHAWHRVGEAELPAGSTTLVVVARDPGYAFQTLRVGVRASSGPENGGLAVAYD